MTRDAPAELPDRDTLISHLVALRDAGEAAGDERATFVAGELRVALYALVQAHNTLARSEPLGSLQFQRLLTECALRLAWTAGEFTTGNSHGWPEAAAGWSERIDRLRKRDQLNLAAASDAIHAVGGGSTPAADELRVKAESIDVAAAPPNLRAMATNPVAKSAYAAHRLCSSLVHPGAGIGRIHKVSDAEMNGRMDMAAYLCIACGNALLRGLNVRVDLTGPSQ